MARLFRIAFIIFLFVAPISSVLYKVYVMDVSFLPMSSVDQWNLQIDINPKALINYESINVPVPAGNASQVVEKLEVKNTPSYNLMHTDAGRMLTMTPGQLSDPDKPLTLLLKVQTKGAQYPTLTSQSSLRPNRFSQPFLDLTHLTEEDMGHLTSLEKVIYLPQDSKYDKLHKIFYFITEEIQTNSSITDISRTLELNEGSELVQAQLMTLLARKARVAARTAVGITLKSAEYVKQNQLKLSYFTEVFANGAWYPINVNQSTFGHIPANFVTLYRNLDHVEAVVRTADSLRVYAQPEKINRSDYTGYVKEFRKAQPVLSAGLLYNLPPSLHPIFYSILLIPFGAVILSIARNVIGVTTFGIFTPVLLALFFLETSLLFGLSFFCVIVLLGFGQRYLLDKFYLLALPRLGILLTLVVISYITFALLGSQTELLSFPGKNLNYFPIVIVTVFIERFSVYFIEEGPWNTFKTLIGTFLVSTACYLLFSVDFLKMVVFTHPELLLVAIGLNILVGNFKGYRILEAFRFNEFRKGH